MAEYESVAVLHKHMQYAGHLRIYFYGYIEYSQKKTWISMFSILFFSICSTAAPPFCIGHKFL